MHGGPFQGVHGLIGTILSELKTQLFSPLSLALGSLQGTVGGNFNPDDYAWGQNGLDDILTQVKYFFSISS